MAVRAGDPGDGPEADGAVHHRWKEQEAQQDEEHRGPDRLQGDQGQGEAEDIP